MNGSSQRAASVDPGRGNRWCGCARTSLLSRRSLASALLALLVINLIFLVPASSKTDTMTCGDFDHRIRVSVHFPDGHKRATTVRYMDFHGKTKYRVPKGISVAYYKVDKWVYLAFHKMRLDFAGRTVQKKAKGEPFSNETTIARIGKYENGPDG